MTCSIEFTPKAAKQFSKLDKPMRQRINDFMVRLESLDDPRTLGKSLQGDLAGMWSYRVGTYRLLSIIKDDQFLILVVHVAHRAIAYK